MKHFSTAQIEALGLDIVQIADALEAAFRASANGEIQWKPKSMVGQGDGSFLMSTFASWPSAGYGIFHMLAGATQAHTRQGHPAYRSMQLLTDAVSGEPLAFVDGSYTSTVLPAGITRLMAARLARSRSGVAAIVGAGTQARVNLEALDGVLPIAEVRIASRSRASAEAFAGFVQARGQSARVMDAGVAMFKDADIIITTVPASPDLQPALDPAWVSRGTFVDAVDLGRSWRQGFGAFERLVVDDRAQAEQQYREGRLVHNGPFDSEIADILVARAPARRHDDERIALIHPGNVVGILAITAMLHRRLGDA